MLAELGSGVVTSRSSIRTSDKTDLSNVAALIVISL